MTMSFNILVVEDENDVRKAIIKALRRSGLQLTEVFEADSGEKGLQIISEQNIDFVLVDLYLPGLNGEEMVKRMRIDPDTQKLPVVFISGENREDRIQMLLKKGSGFISKPFQPEILGETIINMIS